MSVSPARRVAFDILCRVEAEGAYASDALHAELDDRADSRIKPADAALATELTMGVLRWRSMLDFLLERYSKKPLARLDLPVAIALRLGLYQLRCLDKIPARAALHESVELVKLARKASAATFVNAVLRKSADESNTPPADLLPLGMPPTERLAILHSHPLWLVERWLARMGEARTVALLKADNQTPRLTCALSDPNARDSVFGELANSGFSIEPGRLLKNAFSGSGGSPSRATAFREGRISIQDEASQVVPFLIGVNSGDRILDLCCAPGGKTATLARIAGERGFVVGADLYPHRLRAAKTQFARLGLAHVNLVALDAEKALPLSIKFDSILVDAPCSGTGTLARHPEIRWRLAPSQLAEFHRLQVAILRNALAQAAPGARIVYSTCSLEPEENEDVIEEVLRDPAITAGEVHRVATPEAASTLAPHLVTAANTASLFDDTGAFRTFPDRDQTDGFFAAILTKGK